MHRLFADLVVSREGGVAGHGGFALPGSLLLHTMAAGVVVLIPLLLNGVPVSVIMTVTVRFTLTR